MSEILDGQSDQEKETESVTVSFHSAIPQADLFRRDMPAMKEGPLSAWRAARTLIDFGGAILASPSPLREHHRIRDAVLLALLRNISQGCQPLEGDMASVGEADVLVNSRTMGKVRVLRLYADPAIYPRLVLESGFTLFDDPEAQFAVGVPVTGYEITDVTGELRLVEQASCVAPVYWNAADRNMRPSSPRPYEVQIRLTADLDPWRLARIEAIRGPNAPVFWLALWLGFVAANGQHFRDKVVAFRLDVPRENWLQFLAAVHHDEFEVIEVRYDKSNADRFRKALQETTSARSRIVAGDYNEAVTACRRALEAVSGESDIGKTAEDWKAALSPKSDERRANGYAGVFSNLKSLANITVHPGGAPVVYSRSEALFVLRTTENLLALVGDLTNKP